ncbi:MAG: acyl-CoA carboxylase subunit epsilon [Georgenia sp.]
MSTNHRRRLPPSRTAGTPPDGSAAPTVGAPSTGSPAGWSSGGEDDAVAVALAPAGAPRRADDISPAPMAWPAVRVVRGRPDEVELAALVAGIVAASARSTDLGGLVDEAAEPVRTHWTNRAHQLGGTASPGPGAWRWSLHP